MKRQNHQHLYFTWKTESLGQIVAATDTVDADRRIFELLKNESRKADRVKGSFHASAVVFRKKRVLAVGLNRRKSHPLMTLHSKHPDQIFLHSELDAIIRTINKYGEEILKECSIFVLRTAKAGNVGCSKPCFSCQSHIEHFQIPEVYWS